MGYPNVSLLGGDQSAADFISQSLPLHRSSSPDSDLYTLGVCLICTTELLRCNNKHSNFRRIFLKFKDTISYYSLLKCVHILVSKDNGFVFKYRYVLFDGCHK